MQCTKVITRSGRTREKNGLDMVPNFWRKKQNKKQLNPFDIQVIIL